MVLAATFSIVSLGMGMRIWCHEGESLRSQNAIVLLFLSGEMAATLMWEWVVVMAILKELDQEGLADRVRSGG